MYALVSRKRNRSGDKHFPSKRVSKGFLFILAKLKFFGARLTTTTTATTTTTTTTTTAKTLIEIMTMMMIYVAQFIKIGILTALYIVI